MRVQGGTAELTGAIGAERTTGLVPLNDSDWQRPEPTSPVLQKRLAQDKAYRDLFNFAFTGVDPLQRPFGPQVLVQLRTPRKKTASGRIILAAETRDTEKWNTQIGLVLAVGPVAFKRRDTLAPWPEGAWCRPGDFVRTPLHGGDKWEVPVPGRDADEPALFAFFRDLDLLGMVTGDPLMIKSYVV